MKPLISVIVPVYNTEMYLETCIQSILNQTYSNLELVLVDDGSRDNSGFICDSFAQNDSRVTVIHQKNCGVSVARNVALDICKGEYIGFVDSDDYIELDMYETLYNIICNTKTSISCVGFINYSNRNKKISYIDNETILCYNKIDALKNMLIRDDTTSGHLCNKLFRGDLFNTLRFDEKITSREDILMMWDLFDQCEHVSFQNTHKYHYIYRISSATKSSLKNRFSSREAAIMLLKKTEEHYPQILHCAQKCLISADVSLIVGMIENHLENSQEFNDICVELKNLYNKKTRQLLTSKTRIGISLLDNIKLFIFCTRFYLILKNCYNGIKK